MTKNKIKTDKQKPMPTIDTVKLRVLKKEKRFKNWYLLILFLFILFATAVLYRSHIDWITVKEYLTIFVSWPLVILVLGLVFMTRFRNSIDAFLGKLNHMKAAGIELSQQQTAVIGSQEPEELKKEVEELEKNKDGGITLTQEQAQDLIMSVEQLEFKYLALHLVPNTKYALRLISQIEVQKQAFLQIYQVPAGTVNLEAERYAILEALTSNGLALEDRGIMKITEKGVKFLEYEGIK